MEKLSLISRKYKSSYINSIIFLLLVIISTVSIHYYNNYSVKKINIIKEKISKIEFSIHEIEKEADLQINSLLEINKEVIDSYKVLNRITKYINHLNVISWKYGLIFSGFNLSNWKITTDVKVVSDSKSIAFQKTRDFISKYREDKKSLFRLWFIENINWMDEIKFKANFKINNLKNN